MHAYRRRHATATAPAPVDDEDAATLAALDRLLAEIHGKVPGIVEARVQHVADTVRQTVPRLDQLGAGSSTAHAVLRTATSYLPEAVAAYMRLPRDFADRRPVDGGKSSLTVLCDQLDLLGSKMDEVFDAVCRADADALIANGRFIAEEVRGRFAGDRSAGFLRWPSTIWPRPWRPSNPRRRHPRPRFRPRQRRSRPL